MVSDRCRKEYMCAVETLRGPDHTDSLRQSDNLPPRGLGDGLRVQVRKSGGHLATCAWPDPAPIHLDNRCYAAEGARDERLVRTVYVGEGEGPLRDGYILRPAEGYDHAPRDAVQGVVAGRGPHLPAPRDEEVGGVAGGHRPRGVQHQGLVGAGLQGLHQGHDLVQLAVAVEPLVQRVGRRAAYRRGEEPDALIPHPRVGHLMLGDDDDVGTAHHETRVLRGGLLVPAGNHQAHVHAGGALHAVAADGLAEGIRDLLARHADVEVYGLRTLEEPVEVQPQKGELAVVQAEALPHPVPHQEPRVEDGDLRVFPAVEHAVYVDEDAL